MKRHPNLIIICSSNIWCGWQRRGHGNMPPAGRYINPDLRQFVAERAEYLCEYCLVHEDDTYLGCQIEQIGRLRYPTAYFHRWSNSKDSAVQYRRKTSWTGITDWSREISFLGRNEDLVVSPSPRPKQIRSGAGMGREAAGEVKKEDDTSTRYLRLNCTYNLLATRA